MTKSDKRRAYEKNYWQKHRQITVTVPLAKYKQLEKRAKLGGRKVGQHVLAQSDSYEQGDYLPPKIVEDRLQEISLLLRNIANNINQIAKHSNTFRRLVGQKQIIQMLQRLESETETLIRKAWNPPCPPKV